MSKPAGVTASAIVAILGSVVILVIATFMVAGLFIETPQSQRPDDVPSLIAAAAMFAVIACIGIWTGIGLFFLRSWARTSILVFASFLGVVSIFGLAATMAVPMPERVTASTGEGFRQGIALVFGIPLAISVWWLFQFNSRSTKAAFASSATEPQSLRPVSITIIAWMMIAGGMSCVFAVLTRTPLFLFGATFTGWTAGVIYAVFGALTLFIGKGLLDLREEARILAIGWSGLSVFHMGVVMLVPPLRRRMFEMQEALAPGQRDPFDPGTLMSVTFAVSAVLVAITIWFLIRNRDAFGREA